MNKQTGKTTEQKLNILLKERLPSFASYFFKANKNSMAESSLYAYALDLTMFFEYIQETKSIPIKKFSLKDFENISSSDIENYVDYSKIAIVNGVKRPRSDSALKRRFNILSAFYNFYYSQGMINKLPIMRTTSRPAVSQKAPQIISVEDCSRLIRFILFEDLPEKHRAAFQYHFRERDAAIVALLCFGGLKLAECINLNLSDIHLSDHYIYVKNRRYPQVYISNLLEQVLLNYLKIRDSIIPEYGHDEALFLSLLGTRLVPRSLQRMIKKYVTALFGDECTITANTLSFVYKNQVYNVSKSVELTSKLTGNHAVTLGEIYKADLYERLSNSSAASDYFI